MTGGAETFRAFYEVELVALRRLAYRLTGDVAEAEELAQETMVRVYTAWRRIEAEDPRGYARIVLMNRHRSLLRRTRLEAKHLLRVEPSPAREQDENLVWRELLALPVRQRQAIALHFYEGLPEVEVARVLGCPPGTVNSLVHRGLARLRRIMIDDDRSEVR